MPSTVPCQPRRPLQRTASVDTGPSFNEPIHIQARVLRHCCLHTRLRHPPHVQRQQPHPHRRNRLGGAATSCSLLLMLALLLLPVG